MAPKASGSTKKSAGNPGRHGRPLSSQLPTSSLNQGTRTNATNKGTGKRAREDDDDDEREEETRPPKRRWAQVAEKTPQTAARKGPVTSTQTGCATREAENNGDEPSTTRPVAAKGQRRNKRRASEELVSDEEDSHRKKKKKGANGRAQSPDDDNDDDNDDDDAVNDNENVSITGYDNHKPANWDNLPQLQLRSGLRFKDVWLVVWNLKNRHETNSWNQQDIWNWNFDHFRQNTGGVRRNYKYILDDHIPGATGGAPLNNPNWVHDANVVWRAMQRIFQGNYPKPPKWDRDGSSKEKFLKQKREQRNAANGGSAQANTRGGRGNRTQSARGATASSRGRIGGRAGASTSTIPVQTQNQDGANSAQPVASSARRRRRKGREVAGPSPPQRPRVKHQVSGKRLPSGYEYLAEDDSDGGYEGDNHGEYSPPKRPKHGGKGPKKSTAGLQRLREDVTRNNQEEDEEHPTTGGKSEKYLQHLMDQEAVMDSEEGSDDGNTGGEVFEDESGLPDRPATSPLLFSADKKLQVHVGEDEVNVAELDGHPEIRETVRDHFKKQQCVEDPKAESSDGESDDPDSPTKESNGQGHPIMAWQVIQCGFEQGEEWVNVVGNLYRSLGRANRRALRVFRHVLDTASKVWNRPIWEEDSPAWTDFKKHTMSREIPFRAQIDNGQIVFGKVTVKGIPLR
jgi:hypothetical protein